jgi:phospholipid/cholesterol/gamma-HCH transport system substrate-binding protein
MMQNNVVETLIGAAVIAIAGVFLAFAYRTSDAVDTGQSYRVTARVSNAAGLAPGTDVRIAGVKVGTVVGSDLDNDTFEAVLTLNIDKRFRLAEDTSLSCGIESLLGGNYVVLQPGAGLEAELGGEPQFLKEGDQIGLATGCLELGSLIGQLVFGTGDAAGKK